SYSPDGRSLATTGDDQTVLIWDAETGRVKSRLAGHREEVVGCVFTPDGRRLISCDRKGKVNFWDLAASKIDRSFSIDVGRVQSLDISPDGRFLATSGEDAVIWDFIAGRVLTRLKGIDGEMFGLTFSHDGLSLAIACKRAMQVWKTPDFIKCESYEIGLY